MDVQVQVAGQITSKPTTTGGTKFDIPLSNGMRASTFDAALATKVSQFGAAVFTARIEQKPNPRGGNPYTNIVAAAGPGESLSPEIPQAGTPIQSVVAAAPFVPQGAPSGDATPIVPAGAVDTFPPEVTTRNTKRDAITVAYSFVGQHLAAGAVEFEDAIKWADSLALKLYSDMRSHEASQQARVTPAPAVTPTVVAADPHAVAAYVAEEAGKPVVQVGTESVDPEGNSTGSSLPWATA